jgi:hypothetical protein
MSELMDPCPPSQAHQLTHEVAKLSDKLSILKCLCYSVRVSFNLCLFSYVRERKCRLKEHSLGIIVL